MRNAAIYRDLTRHSRRPISPRTRQTSRARSIGWRSTSSSPSSSAWRRRARPVTTYGSRHSRDRCGPRRDHRSAAVHPDRRPVGGRRGDRRGPGVRAADAPPAPGRRGQREDGGGGGRAGIGGPSRVAGRADGPDRDPRAPAPCRARATARRTRRAGRVPLRITHARNASARSTTRSPAGWRRS